MVGQTVEQGAGQPLGAECRCPLVERQVARDHRGPALVALRDQFEQELGAGLGERHEAQLIDDEQLDGDQLLLQTQQPSFIAGLQHLVDQRRRRGEGNWHAFLACGQPQPEGDMGFASSAGAESNDVLAPVDPLAACQFQNLHLVQLRDRLEVEAVQAFDGREFGGFDPPFDHPPLAIDQFHLDQPRQELHMIQPLGSALTRNLLVFPQECRQLQCLQVVGVDLGLKPRLAH